MIQTFRYFAAALAVTGMVALAPARASTPSSPEELAATANLNHDIAKANSDADGNYAVLQKAYLQKKQDNEQLWQDYRAKVKTAEDQQAQYQEEKKRNDLLQQQYQAELKHD
jgi:flagellar motility protein MotE (MotC chaperone)